MYDVTGLTPGIGAWITLRKEVLPLSPNVTVFLLVVQQYL